MNILGNNPIKMNVVVVTLSCLITLGLLFLSIPLAEAIGTKPQTLSPLIMAGASCVFLYAVGIRANEWKKHIITISTIALIFSILGRFILEYMLKLIAV